MIESTDTTKSQAVKFREAAKEIQADVDADRFDETLKAIAGAKRANESNVKPQDQK